MIGEIRQGRPYNNYIPNNFNLSILERSRE